MKNLQLKRNPKQKENPEKNKKVIPMKNKIGALVVSIFFITNMTCIVFQSSIEAKEIGITWSCNLHVNEYEGKQDDVVFGEAPDANDGPPVDSYDIVKPPTPMAPYVKAIFTDNLPSPYDSLWKDYRQYPDASKIWNLTVQWMPSSGSSPTTVTMSWFPSEIDDSEYTSVNLCTDNGIILKNMRVDNTYTFSCPAYAPQNFKIRCERTNNPPSTPSIPSGVIISGYHGTSYTYSTSSTDPDGDDLSYRFDWGDTTIGSWLGSYQSGELIHTSYIWKTPGTYQIKAKARDSYGTESNWSSALSVTMTNRAPVQPSNPSPQHTATQVTTNPVLSWAATDPDGDLVNFDVYFGTMNPPVKLVDNQSASSFHPAALSYQTTYYWKTIAWDNFGSSTSGPVWSFTTQTTSGGSSGNGDTNQTNDPPVANASQSEQTGFVNTLLIFNGSRSYDLDGYLTKWSWDFGDGTNGTGERTIHAYHSLGIYTVTLTVTDNDGATGTDTITVEVGSANWPPTKPVIKGTRIGTKNKAYLYTVSSIDADNDFLQYTLTWGDGTHNTSEFQPNGTLCSFSHSWDAAGKYIITATATDNTTLSQQTTSEVFIDVFFIGMLGFLFDTDNDGSYDSFYTNATGMITSAQILTNGSYLLDTDSDGKWNYLYNPSTGSLGTIDTGITTIENQWIYVIIMVVAFLVIACIVYLYKKNYF
jgi:PKD repeat protein